MSSPALHRVWRGIYSRCVPALSALTLSTLVAAAQPEVAAACSANSWACSSDRNLKENFQPVDVAGVLQRVVGLPLYLWNAKGTAPNVKHLGPTAQDFMAAFALGNSDKMIGMQDADGVALAAIQGLNQRLEEQRQSLDEQQQRIAELEDSVSQLETLRSEIAVLRQALTALQKGRMMPVARR